jgi:hypothetical protein
MKKHSDHNGKSKTASAVDASPYREQQEVQDGELSPASSYDEIARAAYELWRQRGCPEGSADQDWFEAAEQVRAKANSQNARMDGESGWVRP